MADPVVVIMAAGQGTRMRSKTPKLLHQICGKPMIWWTLTAARQAGARKIVVVDAAGQPLRETLSRIAPEAEVAVQQVARGTGDAARAALAHIEADDTVLVITADTPLIRAESLRGLAAEHERSGAAATILTAVLDEPGSYGRVVRDDHGEVLGVVEAKGNDGDASAEQLRIREVNSGIFAFNGAALHASLPRIGTDNAQGEYYLPDVLSILREDGDRVAGHVLGDPVEMWGVNDRLQLNAVTQVAQRRIHEGHMRGGATIISPLTTVIDVDVRLGVDVTILPGTNLHGETVIADDATVGPNSTLRNVTVGEGSVLRETCADGAVVGARVSVGPFCYLRPGTRLHDDSKAGTYVELKNTELGKGSKVPHLSYIGDASIGEGTNLGAATITANYDGYTKHRTIIGAHVHTSVDTTLIAPVELADGSHTGAGSVISKDVPAGALGIARARQTNIEGYDEKVRARHREP